MPTAQPLPLRCASPDGRFEVRVAVWEARASLWVESPEIWDTQADELVLRFADDNWSLDHCHWQNDALVQLTLRKFPGNHTPVQLLTLVDCVARLAALPLQAQLPLGQLEAGLDSLLRWQG
jgi:hypothetical protein